MKKLAFALVAVFSLGLAAPAFAQENAAPVEKKNTTPAEKKDTMPGEGVIVHHHHHHPQVMKPEPKLQ